MDHRAGCHRGTDRRSGRLAVALLVTALLSGAESARAFANAPDPTSPAASLGDLLVEYFERFQRSQDADEFRLAVVSRYSETNLCQLARSGPTPTRRAAVFALGLSGSMAANDDVAAGLRDPDALVRGLAQQALWGVWFRAGTPAQNASLEELRDLNARGLYREAEELANRLIGEAPRLAEAYNQRAILWFALGRHDRSAADCRKALELNPYHIGALSGLGQCYLNLGQTRLALETFRRALALQPYSEALRQTVATLEGIE